MPIFVSCLSTSSSFLSEVRQREITPLWCTIAKSTESPRYYLLYPKTTPMAEVWFCFGYELYVQCSCRDTCYCLQIVRGWFQSISPHVGFASREYNTAKLSSLVSAAPGLIYLSFKRKIFVRKSRLPISDGFVSLYGNFHPTIDTIAIPPMFESAPSIEQLWPRHSHCRTPYIAGVNARTCFLSIGLVIESATFWFVLM